MSLVTRLRHAIGGRRERTHKLEVEESKQRDALTWRRQRTEELRLEYRRDPTEENLAKYRKSRALAGQSAKEVRRRHTLTQKSRAKLRNWISALRKHTGTPGTKALRAANRMVGNVEAGYNDSAWLREMERTILTAGYGLDWMIPGQPYCGFGCIWSWLVGGGVKLPAGTVYTPNICAYAGQTIDGVRFTRVNPEQAAPGDLVVMDFSAGTGADHVGMARGPMVNGVIPTLDFNTSSGNVGSQSNGGGVYKRLRPSGFVLCVIHPEPV